MKLNRKTGLKRSSPSARKTYVRRVNPERLEQLKRYWKRVPEFLVEHPVCQVWLAENGHSENDIKRYRTGGFFVEQGIQHIFTEQIVKLEAPVSEHVHHRNKRRGARLLDESEWMAVSRHYHEKIEQNKAWARGKGYLRNF